MWDAFAGLMATDEHLAGAAAEPRPRFGYATGVWRPWWRPLRVLPSITTAADSLKEYLVTEAAGFDSLVLVGHSQGGLVIQRCLVRMLSEGRGRELKRIQRVVLLATPNAGSQLLLTTRGLLVRRNPQEKELRPFDELVADTLRTVLRDVVNAPAEPTERSCRIPFSVYAGEQDGVVTRASAQTVFPEAAALPGDHRTIARPTSYEHRTYTTVKRLLLATQGDRDPPVDTVTTLGPANLEVHAAAKSVFDKNSCTAEPDPPLTAYLPRGHDFELRKILSGTFAGGPSRLVILTGESSTGKTRALYEALLEVAPNAPLLHPTDAGDLLTFIKGGRVRSGCVLWLNEAQRFLYGTDGENAAGQLHAILHGSTGIAVVGTLWTDPYWYELTAALPGDPHAQSRALLNHPAYAVRLNVPTGLDGRDLEAWRSLAAAASDVRLWQASVAGAGDGRVVQHLSGGPELFAAYLAGPGPLFTAREHALITAALDARRLGHRGPLPAALLAEAADGDLPAHHRSPDHDWAERDLRALTIGKRDNGTRTDIHHSLTAITAVYPRSGDPARYKPADYLEQHTRRQRVESLGTAPLWQALIEHTTDRSDQDGLAWQAWSRGLRTIAVRLWHKAVTAGHPATALIALGPTLDPECAAVDYTIAHAELIIPDEVSWLLQELRRAGLEHAVTSLLARDPANHVNPTNPEAATRLLRVLREAGDTHAAAKLAERISVHADLTDPFAVGSLLRELQDAGDEQAVTTLLARNPANHVVITISGFSWLLGALQAAGEKQAATNLAERAAAEVEVTDLHTLASWLEILRNVGEMQAVGTLLARVSVSHVDLTDPGAVGLLLRELNAAGDGRAAAVLAQRAAADADLTNPRAVTYLLPALRKTGVDHVLATLLARRSATQVDLTDPFAVGSLLRELQDAGEEEAVTTLLARSPANQVDITTPSSVAWLLEALRRAGDDQAAVRLGERAAAHTNLTNSSEVAYLVQVLWTAEIKRAAATLIERAAADADLADPTAVARLLKAMRTAGDVRAAVTFAERAATHTDLTNSAAVAELLRGLRAGGDAQAVAILLARKPAAHADLGKPGGVYRLLEALEEAGDVQAVTQLNRRAENAGLRPDQFEPYGREPDGQPSRPWTWHSLIQGVDQSHQRT
ncbi:hypothetical protein GCM10009839_38740 [Catenulispora yoronensis]|uniref:Uncharacterized protein n=2 Tax=Catenulispora yoronensis TaxID=450799 RepID=A0ABN2UJJ0_9ACTN